MSSDPTYDIFRRKLADVVLVAINSGVKVGREPESTSCPLGCGTKTQRHPIAVIAAQCWGISLADAASFIVGFDGIGAIHCRQGPYYELGRAYGKRFP